MENSARDAGSLRLPQLAGAALLLALLLLGMYWKHPDTATLQIVGHALSSPAGTDSSFYMEMGEAAFRAPGHRIFPVLFFSEHQKFIYPPSSLFLIEGFDGLAHLGISKTVAWMLLIGLSWLGLMVVAVLFYRSLRGRVTALEAASLVVLGVLFLPFAEALYRGQVQELLTFLWGLSVLLWSTGRRKAAAVVLALTCVFKPQLAVFLLWAVLRKEWRVAGVFAVTIAVLTAASIAHFGLQNNLDYLPVLQYLSRHGEALWANQSVNGLMNRVLRNGNPVGWDATVYPPYRAAVYGVSTAFSALLMITGLLLPRWKKWEDSTADFLFFGGIAVLISPIVWEHHFGAFFFLLVYLLARAERLTKVQWAVLVACTLALANRLPPLDHRMQGPVAIVGAYMLYAGLGVLVLLALEAGSARKKFAVRNA